MDQGILSSMSPLVIIVTLILSFALIVSLTMKAIKAAIAISIITAMIPTIYTVSFADGRGTVHNISEYMAPDIGQQVEEKYDYFKDRDEERPVVNHDKMEQLYNDMLTELDEAAKERARDLANAAKDSIAANIK